LPAPDTADPKIQQLMKMLGGSTNKMGLKVNPNADFLDIQLNGIPYEVAIPAVVRMLSELMEYAVELYKQQEKTEEEEDVSVSVEIR